MTIGERIRQRRLELGLTADDVAAALGKNRATVYRYESNSIEKLPTTVLEPLAEVLGTTPAHLMGWDEDGALSGAPEVSPVNAIQLEPHKIRMVTLYESAAAGFGAYANSTAIGSIPCYIESDWEAANSIAVKIKGDSMYPKIEDGDIVIVCKDMEYDDGKIVIARIDEDEAVVKRLRISPTRLVLESINPEYQDRVFEREDMNRVHIEGVVRKIIKEA